MMRHAAAGGASCGLNHSAALHPDPPNHAAYRTTVLTAACGAPARRALEIESDEPCLRHWTTFYSAAIALNQKQTQAPVEMETRFSNRGGARPPRSSHHLRLAVFFSVSGAASVSSSDLSVLAEARIEKSSQFRSTV